MVVVGKNLSPFCTAMLEAAALQEPMRLQTLAPLLLSVSGGVIYAAGDAHAEPLGVFLVLLNAAIGAATSVSEKRVVSKDAQSPLGWSLYRNALALPLLLVLIFFGCDDAGLAARDLAAASTSCWLLLLASASFSTAAGFLIFFLQTKVSATTTQVASLCYKICTTLLSLLLFPESRRDIGLLAFLGYALSTIGIALYIFPDARIRLRRGLRCTLRPASVMNRGKIAVFWRVWTTVASKASQEMFALGRHS